MSTLKVYTHRNNDPQGYPIVILHGWGSLAARWKRVRELLEEKGFQVFIPDLPGFGGTAPPPSPWSVKDYAEWLKKWCDEQGLAAFYLAGHSFGGGIAAVFSAEYPQKVKKLVLVAAAVVRQRTFTQYLLRAVSKIVGAVFLIPGLRFFRRPLRRVLYRAIGAQDYYRLSEGLNSAAMRESFKKIVREDLRGYLQLVGAPTLVVWGDRDKLTPLSHAKKIVDLIPGSRLEVLRGKGHALNLEAPEELAAIIVRFLNS